MLLCDELDVMTAEFGCCSRNGIVLIIALKALMVLFRSYWHFTGTTDGDIKEGLDKIAFCDKYLELSVI